MITFSYQSRAVGGNYSFTVSDQDIYRLYLRLSFHFFSFFDFFFWFFGFLAFFVFIFFGFFWGTVVDFSLFDSVGFEE